MRVTTFVKAEKVKEIIYVDLAYEIADMWDVESAIIVPIVVSVNGLITKSLDRYLKTLAWKVQVRYRRQNFSTQHAL